MVKVTADTIVKKDGQRGVDVQATLEGNGIQIASESLAAIQGIMMNLRDADMALHVATVRALLEEPDILLGEEPNAEKNYEKEMADLTSRSVIGKGGLS